MSFVAKGLKQTQLDWIIFMNVTDVHFKFHLLKMFKCGPFDKK